MESPIPSRDKDTCEKMRNGEACGKPTKYKIGIAWPNNEWTYSYVCEECKEREESKGNVHFCTTDFRRTAP